MNVRACSLGVLVLGCGGAPPAKSVKPKPSLAEAIATMSRPAVTPGQALVTFAVFLTGAPPNRSQMRSLTRAVEGAAGVPLRVVGAPVDAALPLDLNQVAATAGQHGPAIRAARSVVFVRYTGASDPGLKHVRAVVQGALAVTEDAGAGPVVVDLGTHRADTPDSLRGFLESAGWAREQIGVAAHQDPSGQVVFTSRGMARLGCPDLELTVNATEARAAFGRFQETLRALQAQGHAKPGDAVGGVTLQPCSRPPEAYEHECVRM